MSLFNFHTIVLISFEKIFLQNFIVLIQVLTNFLIFTGFIFVLKLINVNSYILSLYLSYIVTLMISLLTIPKALPKERSKITIFNTMMEISKWGFISQLGNVIQYLNYRLSYYILNHYASIASVGIYSVGIMVSESIWMISGSISLVQYARIANSNDIVYSRNLTLRLAKLSFTTTLFAVLILLLLPANIFQVVFGKDFRPVKEVMLYLSTGISIFGYSVIVSHYFAGVGKYAINTMAAFVGLVILCYLISCLCQNLDM